MLQLMYVWFDRPKLSFNGTESLANIDIVAAKLMKIIRYETELLGLPNERIVIGINNYRNEVSFMAFHYQDFH